MVTDKENPSFYDKYVAPLSLRISNLRTDSSRTESGPLPWKDGD